MELRDFNETQTKKKKSDLSAFIHADSLLVKLAGPNTGNKSILNSVESNENKSRNRLIALDIQQLTQSKALSNDNPHTSLNLAHNLLKENVLSSRDRLSALNTGRRALIERRLEYIARKLARSKGERFNRPIALADALKEDLTSGSLLSQTWEAFASEASFYFLLEVFFLKNLDAYGFRCFDASDFSRLNFAAHDYLNQRAVGFAHDKHCWNFVRTNLYSWFSPNSKVQDQLLEVVNKTPLNWSDQDLWNWIAQSNEKLGLKHLSFVEENRISADLLSFLEQTLNVPFVSSFQGQAVFKKVFIPNLELGCTSLQVLDRYLTAAVHSSEFQQPDFFSGLGSDTLTQISKSLWACESESLEVYFTEVMALLKIQRIQKMHSDLCQKSSQPATEMAQRVPQAVHIAQLLGLELHNLEQLPLNGPDVIRLHQGSAGQIQQFETFDLSIVTDHIDRARSARWLKALSEQLPYWRSLVSAGTNLNWGELHLYLSLSKLKENGVCVYLSHRVLPEGGDGEKLRKHLLGIATLEYFVELEGDASRLYRYLYIFRRTSQKSERDSFKPKFGKLNLSHRKIDLLDSLEEANSSQAEIAERGWDHLFVRGAAPLIRHLNHKFPKLFQLATIQNASTDGQNPSEFSPLFNSQVSSREVAALEAQRDLNGLRFEKVRTITRDQKCLVFPHNPADLPWLEVLLNSSPVQFWIRHQILLQSSSSRLPKLQDLRSAPIVDLTLAPVDLVHEALEWLGSKKASFEDLRSWACDNRLSLVERQARFVALTKKYAALKKVSDRYTPLFDKDSLSGAMQLRPDSIRQFYPSSLLVSLTQLPGIRIQYNGKERTRLLPENWSILDSHTVNSSSNGRTSSYIIINTSQGTTIQVLVPSAICNYVLSQLKELVHHTWGEALILLRAPKDVQLFTAQVSEITRVVHQTESERSGFLRVLDLVALDLFEISHDLRQYLSIC